MSVDKDFRAKSLEADQPTLDYQQTDVFVYDGKLGESMYINDRKRVIIVYNQTNVLYVCYEDKK